MKTIMVSKKSWRACVDSVWIYDLDGGTNITKSLNEQYGITEWRKIPMFPGPVRVTFTDEKKMIYWLLRWS
jgi:hypothetical protein